MRGAVLFRWLLACAGLACLLAPPGWARGFLDRKVATLGEAAPDFKLRDTSGREHLLSAYRGKILMVLFWSATCPFVVRYDERIKQIARDYADQGVVVMGIDSNSNETVGQIQQEVAKRGIPYPVLIDPGNQVADLFGAVTTPHVYLVDQKGLLVYEGAVDDQGWSGENPVQKHYVREVLEALLSGRAPGYSTTKTVGCTVKRAF